MMSLAAKINVCAGNLPLKDQFPFYISEGTIELIKRASETEISKVLV